MKKEKSICPHKIISGYCKKCKSKINFGKKVKGKTLVDSLNEMFTKEF